jgi:hypothetical protein
MKQSELENLLLFQITAVKLPPHRIQYKFHETRKWRLDIAWPDQWLAVECEGTAAGTNAKTGRPNISRHQTIGGFRDDCEKYNAAVELGWRVLRYTLQEIKNGKALAQIERIITRIPKC